MVIIIDVLDCHIHVPLMSVTITQEKLVFDYLDLEHAQLVYIGIHLDYLVLEMLITADIMNTGVVTHVNQ